MERSWASTRRTPSAKSVVGYLLSVRSLRPFCSFENIIDSSDCAEIEMKQQYEKGGAEVFSS